MKSHEWLVPVEWMKQRDDVFRGLFGFDGWLEALVDEGDAVPVFFDLAHAAHEDSMDVEGTIGGVVQSTILSDLGAEDSPDNELGGDPGEEPAFRGYAALVEDIHLDATKILRSHAERGELLDGPRLRSIARDRTIQLWTSRRGRK